MLSDQDDFEQLLAQPERARQRAQGICQEHGLPFNGERIEGGSRLLFATTDGKVVKIFPRNEGDFCQTEALFLAHLYRRLTISTPRLYAVGNCEGYPYLVMERLDGTPLNRLWPVLSQAERRDLVTQLGQATRALHSLPAAPFTETLLQWDSFIDSQQTNLLVNQRAFGLADSWLAQLPVYMDALPLDLHAAGQMVPLHTELMLEHLFVRREGGPWVLSGLIDFEPSMIGDREYEFCAVGLFITQGNPDLFRAFLSAYGYTASELMAELSGRIMRWLLLHRYGNLRRFLELLPEDCRFERLEQLERYWYGL